MFSEARLKLTAWYLLLIFLVSVLFSIALYNLSTQEIRRLMDIEETRRENPYLRITTRPLPNMSLGSLRETAQRLQVFFIVINGIIILVAGGAAWVLAGKTLSPIQQMMEEQNRFITDSSHELRTPLTSLRSEIEVALRNKDLTLDEARQLLKSNLEETIALQNLSNRLLELAQNNNKLDPSDLSKTYVRDILPRAIKTIQPQADKKHVKIKTTVGQEHVFVSQEDIVEVLIILLDNAIKYSPAKGSVEVTAKRARENVRISVTDHGAGIVKEDLPYIFNRFYRSSKSRTREGTKGYGLGLAIAKKIIDAHDGKITAESIPDKKTTFSILLPINRSQE